MRSRVSSSTRSDCPAKRPADFTSTTRPSTSAVVGMIVVSPITTGVETDAWKTSPICAFSEFSSSVKRMLSWVPEGTTTGCGGGGTTGAVVATGGGAVFDAVSVPAGEGLYAPSSFRELALNELAVLLRVRGEGFAAAST